MTGMDAPHRSGGAASFVETRIERCERVAHEQVPIATEFVKRAGARCEPSDTRKGVGGRLGSAAVASRRSRRMPTARATIRGAPTFDHAGHRFHGRFVGEEFAAS